MNQKSDILHWGRQTLGPPRFNLYDTLVVYTLCPGMKTPHGSQGGQWIARGGIKRTHEVTPIWNLKYHESLPTTCSPNQTNNQVV